MADSNREQRRAADRARRRKAVKATAASGAVLATGAGLVVLAPPAQAADFTVTSNADSGAGSLRDALASANADTTDLDNITFGPGVTSITLATPIDILGPVTIAGAGVTVSGGDATQIFAINAPAPGLAGDDVVITGLTLRGGAAGSGGAIVIDDGEVRLAGLALEDNASTGDGGAIYQAAGSLTIADSTLTDNASVGGGGGVYTEDGQLVIERSTLTGNTSEGWGGALYTADGVDSVLIAASTFSGNQATESGGAVFLYETESDSLIVDTTISGNIADGDGGGIAFYYYEGADSTLTIERSTISGNTAGERGGGAFLQLYNGGVDIVNTTISGNTAGQEGGGIFLYGDDSAELYLDVRQTTISGNTASTGGGIFLYYGGASLDGVIIANNIATDGVADLDAGDSEVDPVAAVQFSLIEAPIGEAVDLNDGGGNLLGVDPILGPLAANGGLTQTHALLAGSPAINTGDPASAGLATDQRSTGFARIVAGRIDIGAFEVQVAVPPGPGPVTPTDPPATPGGAAQPVTATPSFTG
ncbi:MAG: choice-of-anchor Q domain-containing protein [Acidimicrobiales bacterium]